jgi:site-specific recombinase XerD
MKFSRAIDLYIADMRGEGRINSANTECGYRDTLNAHAADVDERDPRSTFREDVKRTLERWPNPNTRRKNRSILVSFYDWAMQELDPPRDSNPARQTRPPKARKPQVYRMTREEVVAFLEAAATRREKRVAYLGVCAGIRNYELRHLQRRHFERPRWEHVSADIAKGGRERWVPVLPELEPVVAEILASVGPTEWDSFRRAWLGEYVIPAERWRDPGRNTERMDLKLKPASRQVLRTVVMELGRRARIHAHLTPHSMRHAFGDHVTRHAGIKNAQALLGHADVGTTQMYTGAPTLDELAAAIAGYRFGVERTGVPVDARIPREAPTGIEPVYTALQAAA